MELRGSDPSEYLKMLYEDQPIFDEFVPNYDK